MSLCEQGYEERDALQITLRELGDPEIIGKQLDEAYRPEINKNLPAVLVFIIMVFSCFFR